MSSSGIFDTESKNSSSGKVIVIAVFALIVLVGIGFGFYQYDKSKHKTPDQIRSDQKTKEISDNTILMLAQPTFSGDEFSKQILGKGRLQRYDWVNKDVYFSYPQTDAKEFEDFKQKFFINPAKIEPGKETDGKFQLGRYSLMKTPESGYFFRTPFENVKIETDQIVTFPYKTATYDISLKELNNFVNDSSVYGGRMIAGKTEGQNPMLAFANHGIMVSKPNEPSLNRLVEQLLKDESINREEKIQKLLNFVTNEIEYSYSEALSGGETLKRADETLMTRSADCSNKTILMASLLEQIGEEYLLLYAPQHITVAVLQGNYTNENKLDFKWNDKDWMIAETTLPGFQIGKTKVNEAIVLGTINYVQNPKQIDIIFDANSYNLLKFY